MQVVRSIPAIYADRIAHSIARLNKKAVKLGVAKVEVSTRLFEQTKIIKGTYGDATIITEMAEITVTGETVRVAGWTLNARIDFEDGMTLVNSRPGIELPESFRTTNQFCQHCSTLRRRNSVFALQDMDGKYMQVGRNCLADFLGHDPEAALFSFSIEAFINGEFDDCESLGGGRSFPCVSIESLMNQAAQQVRTGGFISAKVAAEREICSTASNAVDLLVSVDPQSAKYRAANIPTEFDKEQAAKVLDWAKTTICAKADKTDFEHNVSQLLEQTDIRTRNAAKLVALFGMYARVMTQKAEKDAIVNAHVGTIGQRTEFAAKYLGENWFETAYGSMVIARFATPSGLLVYKGASPFWKDGIEAGNDVTFTATVKSHEDYKGMAQTLVQRCKVAK